MFKLPFFRLLCSLNDRARFSSAYQVTGTCRATGLGTFLADKPRFPARSAGLRKTSQSQRCRRLTVGFLGLVIILSSLPANAAPPAATRPRLLVLTDIGGDPDDHQSMIRLMVYSNKFLIEGLVASAAGTPGELERAVTRPDLIREIVTAFGQVRPNLIEHDVGWPTANALLNVVKTGNPRRGRDHIGPEHDTEGSRWIIAQVDAGTPKRPLNIAIWGGQTDLAQALWRVRADRGGAGLAEFVARFRVYDIADQDGLADWMGEEFPGMFYILSKAPRGRDKREAVFRGMYLTGDEALTSRKWIDEHIRNAGPLGALYPVQTWTAPNPHGCLKEGDTPSWFFFLPQGGNDPADPTRPGWGGQYRRSPSGWFRDDHSARNDPRESVSRWRPAFQQDFSLRMSWCRGK